MLEGLPRFKLGDGNFDPITAIEDPMLVNMTAVMMPTISMKIDEQKLREKNVLNVRPADISPSSVLYSRMLK